MTTTTKSTQRAYSAAHFVLELGEKEVVGFVKSVDGGGLKTDIIDHKMGPSLEVWRQLGRPAYADLKFEVGMSMAASFYTWIEGFFTGQVIRKHGAIVAGDFHYKERARRTFKDALISEVTMPTLDATDKNACYMNITVVPQTLEYEPGTGKDLSKFVGKMEQKLWTAANFFLRIKGFDDALKRVTKIDSFTIKQKIIEHKVGNMRDPMRIPGALEFPNVTFYIPEVDAKPLIDHFTKTVIRGEKQPAARLTGEIGMLAQQSAFELADIELKGIDIASIEPDKSDSSSGSIKQVKVEISVESMAFTYGDAANLA